MSRYEVYRLWGEEQREKLNKLRGLENISKTIQLGNTKHYKKDKVRS